MSESELASLASLADQLPEERRRQIERQLPVPPNPQSNVGMVAGLAHAAEIAASQSEDAARALREVAAVAAARAIAEKKAYEQARALFNTPAARAEVEAEVEAILSGNVRTYPLDDLLGEMDALIEAHRAGKSDGTTPNPH
jgi:membrane protein involved in colicin uptake